MRLRSKRQLAAAFGAGLCMMLVAPATAVATDDDKFSTHAGFDSALEKQDKLTVLLAEISEEYPEEYAAAKFDKEGTLILGFKGIVPANVKKQFLSVTSDVDFVDNMGFNEAELLEAVDATFDPIEEALDGPTMLVEPYPFEQKIVVNIDGDAEVSDAVVDELGLTAGEEPQEASVDPQYISGSVESQENANTVGAVVEEVTADSDNHLVEVFDSEINVEPIGDLEPAASYRGGQQFAR